MTTIVPFVIRPRASAPAPGCAATIIIFPGVRYEHGHEGGDTAETPPQAAGAGRRGRKEKAR